MPAPVRNPAFAAMEIAALARLHPGRFHAGLGHGVGVWMHQVGAKPASQLALLEETVSAVRALLAGGTVDAEGRYVRLRGVALGQPPATVPPVSVGVRGPRSLELSGRVADGTVLDWLSSADYVRWARERIDAGRAVAGRDDPHRLTVYACAAADAAAEAALTATWEERRGEGGQGPFMEAPLGELAAIGADWRPYLDGLAAAGADCVVLVSPDPRVPLDAAGMARRVRG